MHITLVLCLNDGTGGKPAVASDVLPGAGSKSRNCRQHIGRKPPQCGPRRYQTTPFRLYCAGSSVGLGRHQGRGTARSKTRARSLGVAKMANEWPEAACVQLQSRKSDGQVEAPWPGAFRIEIEHPVNGLDPRSMRVAGNDHVHSVRRRIELQFLKVVQNVD